MKHASLFTVLFLVLGLVAPNVGHAQTAIPTPSAIVQNFYDRLLETMKQGEPLGFEGRFKKLRPAVEKAFNLPLMTRIAAGPAWRTASPSEQQKLTDAFSTFSVANYASQFTKFNGEKFIVQSEKPATGGGTIVETKLVPKDSEPVTLNYLVRNDENGQPRIVDVYLDGSISQLATRRAEFTALIDQGGFPALLSSLNEKNKKMGGA